MKYALSLFAVLILCSCGPTATQHPVNESSATGPQPAESPAGGPENQDSLRTVLLRKKENTLLKESFLQELYIRNAVRVSGDSVLVTLPFDLHGPDCGAPDCYSTDVRFSFALGKTFAFPHRMRFGEHEHGCVDSAKKRYGTFQLVEASERHVIYYAAEPKRTLVLFRSNAATGTAAWYFTGLARNRITGKNVYDVLNDYSEEDQDAIYPFTSWLLTTTEYTHFFHN